MSGSRKPPGLPIYEGLARAESWMRKAVDLARATPEGDIPVGAMVLDARGAVIGRGVNRREADKDSTAHAEVLAIREASQCMGDWRLDNCTLVVTLEPCTMCAGAIVGARVSRLIFGAFEPKTGACGSVFDVVRDTSVLHKLEVRGGILQVECAQLLTDFFASRRPQQP